MNIDPNSSKYVIRASIRANGVVNKSDVSPIEIINKNKELKEKLYIRDDFKNNKIMHILINIHLSPKLLINKFRITKSQ